MVFVEIGDLFLNGFSFFVFDFDVDIDGGLERFAFTDVAVGVVFAATGAFDDGEIDFAACVDLARFLHVLEK